MSVAVQDSLLDFGDEPTPAALRPERVPLSHGAWIDVQRGWLAGSAALFGRLVEAVPWKAERRRMYDRTVDVPRLLRFYGADEPLPDPALDACRDALNAHYQAELGERFTTAGLCFYDEDAALPDRALDACRDALTAHYRAELGEAFTTAGLCFYRDGRDSVAFHGDTIGRGSSEDTMVAIVSLGEARPLLLRPRQGGGGQTLRYSLGHGDLIVMGGSCQRTWEHGVPKSARPVGPRISVQFRPRGVR